MADIVKLARYNPRLLNWRLPIFAPIFCSMWQYRVVSGKEEVLNLKRFLFASRCFNTDRESSILLR
jgi:hypothetical protein